MSKNLSIFATMTASVTKKTKEKHQYTYLQAAKETFLPFQWKNPSKIAEFSSRRKNAALAEVNANSRIILPMSPNVSPISQLITHVLLQGTLGFGKKTKSMTESLTQTFRVMAANVWNSLEFKFRTQLSTIAPCDMRQLEARAIKYFCITIDFISRRR